MLALMALAPLSCSSHAPRPQPVRTPTVTGAPTRALATGWQYQGMTFISWSENGYLLSSTLQSLDRMAALNVKWVAIIPHWFMDDRSSTRIYPEAREYTPSDASVRYIIQQAHARGLKVMLKPHVDPRDGTWRGSITPSDPEAWFASYRDFILHYAQIAADTGTELLSMSNELRSMTGPPYAPKWRALVAEVRQRFPGQLTAAANWGPRNWAEFLRVEWWDAVDLIGINAYFSLTGEPNPTVEMARAGWFNYINPWGGLEHWVEDVKGVADRFARPVLFTEIGYNSNPTAGDPWYTSAPAQPDMVTQQNCVEAAFQVWQNVPYMVGGFWWEWSINPNGGGPTHTGMALNNKPAAQTIATWFGGGGGLPDTSPPSVPTDLVAVADGQTAIRLTWRTSSDDVRVTGYRILRDGAAIATVSETTYTDRNLSPATTYRYQVVAFDAAGNASAPSAPVDAATAGATAPVRYSFESGTEGWLVSERCVNIWTSGSIAHAGRRSLALYLDRTASTTPGYAAVQPAGTLLPGATVTLHVYLKAEATNVRAMPYVQDANRSWLTGPRVTLTPMQWIPLTITIPATAAAPMHRVGIQFSTSGAAFSGYVNVDDIRW